MKQTGITVLFVLAGWLSALYSQDTLILDKIVAKVGSEVIFHSDVESQLLSLRERKQPTGREEQCTVLEGLMAQAMLVHYARIDSVQVSDEEINSSIDGRMNQILAYMNNDRKMFQEVYGQTVSEMRESVKEDMQRKLLGDRMQAKILENVQVTPSEVVEFYNNIPKDSLPYFNAEVELSDIVVYPKVNSEERQKALEKINQIQEQIRTGADFADMARKYSQDASSRSGGDLDWSQRGSMVPEFEAAAFQLETGQVSDVVETEFGFHLIQLMERRGNQIHTRHILIRPEITQPDLDKVVNLLDSVKMLVETGMLTFAEAVMKFGDKHEQSYSNGGRMINPKTGNTFFETGDVDSEIYFTIDTLDIGQITPPIEFRSPIGDKYYKIVRLNSRSSPHQASLKQDYSRIQDAAKENKRTFAFSDWIDKHIGKTYITIDPSFMDCPNIERWQPKWMPKS